MLPWAAESLAAQNDPSCQEPRTVAEIDDANVRTVIVHYHLFKNAGTSIDFALQAGFGARWSSYEGVGPRVSPEDLSSFLIAHPNVVAVSSHRALLPPPTVTGIRVIPIVMVRHPLDRIRSSYAFERTQEANTPGAHAAKQHDFRGYVDWRLARPPDRSLVNFQTWRLSMAGSGPDELSRALDAIERLPFIGLVEDFEASFERLRRMLQPWFPTLELPIATLNRTADTPATILARLRRMRAELGVQTYSELRRRNRDDLSLWRAVKNRYRVAEAQTPS